MKQDTRFQMRCDRDFLKSLDRLKKKLGLHSRPEVVRMAVFSMLTQFTKKDKDAKSS